MGQPASLIPSRWRKAGYPLLPAPADGFPRVKRIIFFACPFWTSYLHQSATARPQVNRSFLFFPLSRANLFFSSPSLERNEQARVHLLPAAAAGRLPRHRHRPRPQVNRQPSPRAVRRHRPPSPTAAAAERRPVRPWASRPAPPAPAPAASGPSRRAPPPSVSAPRARTPVTAA